MLKSVTVFSHIEGMYMGVGVAPCLLPNQNDVTVN